MKTSLKNKEDFYKKAKKEGLTVSICAQGIIEKLSFSPVEKQEIVIKTLTELGITDNNSTYEIIAEFAKKNGLTLVHPIQALEHALAYTGTWITYFTTYLVDAAGDPDLLGADRLVGGPWLRASCDYPGRQWDRAGGFAFAVSQVLDPVSLDTALALEPLVLTDEQMIEQLKAKGFTITKEY